MSTDAALPKPIRTTLAGLIQTVLASEALREDRRREIVSGIRTVARVLGSEPHLLSCHLAELRERLYGALPLAAGVTDKRWRNAKSLLRQALALADPCAMPGRSRAGLLPEWETLLGELAAAPFRRGLSRFSKWCSARSITPASVDQATFDAYGIDLVEHCLVRSPEETHQTAGLAWREAAAVVPRWPQTELIIVSRRRNPSPDWDAYPESLVADINGYFAPRNGGCGMIDLRRTTPVMRASTIESKKALLRQFLAAVVATGVDPNSLCSLGDVVKPEIVQTGLERLLERSDNKSTGRIEQAAHLMLSIARHHVGPDQAGPDVIDALQDFARNVRHRQQGMTLKNRRRLQQFDDPRLVERLLCLPEKMMVEASAPKPPTAAEARIAQLAIAIEINTVAPCRIGNIAALELGRTLHIDRDGQGSIILDHTTVKNDVDLEIPLPARTVRRIQTYLKCFHPLLAPEGCTMLFPSAVGGHKRNTVLSNQIKECLARRCGIEMNAHLFRHFAAKVYLKENPGDYGTVKLLLGHKSIDTTIRAYCGTETAAAFQAFDNILAGTRRTHGATGRTRAPARARL